MLDEEVSPRVVTITNSRVQPLAYSKRRWSNSMGCKPRFSSSSFLCFFKVQNKKQKVVIHEFEWRPAAGWRTSKLWYQMLESGEAASAEEITQCSAVEEEPAYGRLKPRYAERETHTHTKRYNSIIKSMCNSYKWATTFAKGYKVTLYSDSLRATVL